MTKESLAKRALPKETLATKNLDQARSKRHAIKRYAANARKMSVYVGELKVIYQTIRKIPTVFGIAFNLYVTIC